MMLRTLSLRLLLTVAAMLGAVPAHALADPVSPVRVEGVTPRPLGDDEVYSAGGRSLPRRASTGVAGAAIGARSLLVLRVYYTGENWPAVTDPSMAQYSVASVQSRLTGATTSSSAMFMAQSGGQVSLTGLNGPDVDVSDWLTLGTTMPLEVNNACNAGAVASKAFSEATTAGLPWQSYDHVMIIFPLTAKCGWAGLGQVGGSVTWINGLYANYPRVDSAVAAHEIGHNLGVAHASSLACTASTADPVVAVLTSTSCTLPWYRDHASSAVPTVEYGDPFEMMGTVGYTFPWQGTELMSTWHRAQLLELPTADQQEITSPGAYTLHSADDPSGVRLIRIARGVGPSSMSEIALELRPGGSLFDRWSLDPGPPAAGGVLVRLVPSLTTASQSFLLDATPETGEQYSGSMGDYDFITSLRAPWRDAALQPGRTLLDQPSGLSITVESVVGDTATIRVEGGPLVAASPTPTPTSTPAATPTPTAIPQPTATPTPTATPRPSATPAPVEAPGGTPTPSSAPAEPVLEDAKLLWPVARKGKIRLTSTRRIIVRFPGAGTISAALGTRWASTGVGGTVTFRLPASAVRRSTIRFRARDGKLAAPRTATLHVVRGVLTFTPN